MRGSKDNRSQPSSGSTAPSGVIIASSSKERSSLVQSPRSLSRRALGPLVLSPAVHFGRLALTLSSLPLLLLALALAVIVLVCGPRPGIHSRKRWVGVDARSLTFDIFPTHPPTLDLV